MSSLVDVSRSSRIRKNLSKTINSPRLVIAAIIVATALLTWYVPVGSKEGARPSDVPLFEGHHLGIAAPQPLKANYSNHALAAQGSRPLALATADLNMDGAPDLITGYGAGDGGYVTVQYGNIESFAPTKPEVFQAIQQGRMPESFLPDGQTFNVSKPADFVLAGDFNLDGYSDVLVGTRSQGLNFLAGNGLGSLAAPKEVSLPGGVTALTSGKFNGGGSINDVAVAVKGNAGSEVLIFDDETGGILSTPASFPLSGEATSIVLDSLDADYQYDLAAATGKQIEIVHGPGKVLKSNDAAIRLSRVERIPLSFTAKTLVSEELVWDRASRHELAVMSPDGAVRVIQRSDIDIRPFSAKESAQLLWEREFSEDDSRTGEDDSYCADMAGGSCGIVGCCR